MFVGFCGTKVRTSQRALRIQKRCRTPLVSPWRKAYRRHESPVISKKIVDTCPCALSWFIRKPYCYPSILLSGYSCNHTRIHFQVEFSTHTLAGWAIFIKIFFCKSLAPICIKKFLKYGCISVPIFWMYNKNIRALCSLMICKDIYPGIWKIFNYFILGLIPLLPCTPSSLAIINDILASIIIVRYFRRADVFL